MKVTAPPASAVRPLSEILAAVRQANCGHCWKAPGTPCTHGPASRTPTGHITTSQAPRRAARR